MVFFFFFYPACLHKRGDGGQIDGFNQMHLHNLYLFIFL
jgi:hypothetical protein